MNIVILMGFAKAKDFTRKISNNSHVFDFPLKITLFYICKPHSMRIKHILFLSLHYQFLTYFWHPDVSIFMKSS